jgi:hypothetical protein
MLTRWVVILRVIACAASVAVPLALENLSRRQLLEDNPGVRAASGPSIESVRQAPTACGILSRIQPQNQPTGDRRVAVDNVAPRQRQISDHESMPAPDRRAR